jgi:hypothetical protein
VGALSKLRRRLAPSRAGRLFAATGRASAIGRIAAASLFVVAHLLSADPLRGQELAVRWLSDPGLEGVAATLAEDEWIFSAFPGIGEIGAVLTDTVTIRLVDEFRPSEDFPVAEPEPWVAGTAVPDLNLISLRGSSGQGGLMPLRQVLRHELAHLALSAATAGNSPRWLQEGYAQFAAGAWGTGEAWRLQLAFMHGDASLHALALRFPRQQQAATLAYLLSYTAVVELHGLSGDAGLRAMFDRLAGGDDFDASLRTVYGLTETQFEEKWRREVAGRYGWLYVLSRASLFWVALTLALLVFGWRRRRYNRMRWEALRRAEAAEAAAAAAAIGIGPLDSRGGHEHR